MSARHAGTVITPLSLKVVVEGKKYELQATDFESPLLAPGDCKARSAAVKSKRRARHDVYGACEFLFPDMKTRTFRLIGIME